MSRADLIIENAAVLTMDAARPRAGAVAVGGGRILAVGALADMQPYRDAQTRILDARGGSVLPGFIESHMHLFIGGAELGRVLLEPSASPADAGRQLRAYAAQHPDDPVIVGMGNGYILFDGQVPRLMLDEILPDRPLALMSTDHHTVWANTCALRAAGLLHGADLPEGHEVVMGGDGLATGTLLEPLGYGPVMALAGLGRVMLGLDRGAEPDPAPDAAEIAGDLAMMRRGLAHAARHGITSIVNMDGNLYTLELLERLRKAGELTARVRVPFHFVPDMADSALETAEQMRARWDDDWLSSGMVKMFMDGVLESGTAFTRDAYRGRPGWHGSARFSAQHFADLACRIDAMDLQIAVHAVGDAAVGRVIDGYEAAITRNGARDMRHRVEHIELADPKDLHRIAALGLIPSMQPLHAPDNDPPEDEPALLALPPDRWVDAYPMRRLRDLGASLALASDWPVVTISVLEGIHGAVNARPWRPGQPDRSLSLLDALHGYTLGGAYAERTEAVKGSLTPGKLADLVILNRDIEAVPAQEIRDLSVMATICGGRLTHDLIG